MVILLFGLKSSAPFNRTQKSGSTDEKYSRKDRFLTFICVINCSATGESKESMSYLDT